ncbi:sodium/proline symporter [Seongchinamella sediminis]|uniref:Sodium/proline symporter n=2 Tax=Seongchinamella sediminis TaxID=2283635 RepID=A0A3L7DY57_9GAMM|nr:sodium/proline symporter [Seongchinamella sediminis]
MFTLIGLSSAFKSRGSRHDYYLADSSVSPWLVGLSAVATNNSGYMFIGVIGYTYVTGFAAFWLMIGWIAGDFLGSLLVHSRLRAATERTGEVSYAGVLANWYGGANNQLQKVIGAVSLLFLLAYAGAQLVAGSKALHVLFGWPESTGAILGAVLVTLYCFAGGIRASIWTDAAQSFVMIVAMAVLFYVATSAMGGPAASLAAMDAIPGFTDWFPADLLLPGFGGMALFVLGWMFAGLSVIAQPHVMVRFMSLDSSGHMRRARIWYYLWFTAFYSLATCVGLLSRIYLGDTASFDAELALPTMSLELLPPALVGLILAGIFAATMSTADSLILSCSATITHDLLPHRIEQTLLIKAATVVITASALALALINSQSVFSLVIMSWSALASAFAPLLLALCLDWRPSQVLSLSALATGLATALLWRWLGLEQYIYEGLPGIIAGLAVLGPAGLHRSPEQRRGTASASSAPK